MNHGLKNGSSKIIKSGKQMCMDNVNHGSIRVYSPGQSAAISTGAFLYLLRVQKEKFSMFGSMPLSVIYLLQKNLLPTGKNTGRIRRQKWFISSEKTILFSIVLFSRNA